ncbi:protein kinase putativephosphorylase kinase-like protein [Leptomonas pyrrhocoris]|uniref:Protein kinase putativephosphorylase kinase-like protein n=1 Tax=Leptomonas pyrrhocoris TaxID=157538 RepID=A0A0M9G926_LEPPY|nr:protein kinase putativephosphorylase kinase-like protein [Leptomonas pyrrhocoris]KPA85237.1 protein kinase putativephosphorylase kinase-like protein [Leptomonas pyrrhocoris]|eukprot:XP_015663676.1 protein kinase putativephosphorylase kinase-like protein [Leptomonas pyrrhocoris]
MESGKVIGDKVQYRLDGSLAVGAFSTVYRCTELSSGRSYAMKIVDKNVASDNHMKEALIREVNALEVVGSSPYVTKLVDKMVSRHNYYLVMELAGGGTLLDLIREQRQELKVRQASLSIGRDMSDSLRSAVPTVMQYDRVQHFFKQLLLALSALHDRDVVHRDVKPENILLNKRRTRLVLSDFGFACHAPPGAELHRACGTLRYCAPELLRENPRYDGRKVDVWAAGVTLYVMLFGGHPFRCANQDPDNLLEVITTTRFRIPRPIPAEVEDMLHHMLCVDPVARWSVRQLLQHPWMAALRVDLRSTSVRSASASTHNFAVTAPAQYPLHDSSDAIAQSLSEDCPPIDAIPSDEEIVDDGFYQSSSANSTPMQSGDNVEGVNLKPGEDVAARTAASLLVSPTASSAERAPPRCELLRQGSVSTSMVSIDSSADGDDERRGDGHHGDADGTAHVHGVARDVNAALTEGARRSSSDAGSSVSTNNTLRDDDQLSYWWMRYVYGLFLTTRIVARFVGFFALCVVAVAVRVVLRRDLVDLPLPEVVRNYVAFLLSTPLRRSHLTQHGQQQRHVSQRPLAPHSHIMTGATPLSSTSPASHPRHGREHETCRKADTHPSGNTGMPSIPGSGLRHYVRAVDQLMRDSFVGNAVLEHNASLADLQAPLALLGRELSDGSFTSSPAAPSLATIAPSPPSSAQPAMTAEARAWSAAPSTDAPRDGEADRIAADRSNVDGSRRGSLCNATGQPTEEASATKVQEDTTVTQTEDTAVVLTNTSPLVSLVATASSPNLEDAQSETAEGRASEFSKNDGKHYASQARATDTTESGDSIEERSADLAGHPCMFSPITPLPRTFPDHRRHSEGLPCCGQRDCHEVTSRKCTVVLKEH